MESAETLRRKQLLESLEVYQGREALYREGKRFCHVRVEGFEPTEEGLAAQLTLIPTHGLDNQWAPSWNIFARWEHLKTADDLWVAPYIGLKMIFESGLVDAIVRWSESTTCGHYDSERFEQIVERIQRFRKLKLSRQLSSSLKLIYEDRIVGTVTDHFMGEYPEVHGRFAAATVDEELKLALIAYSNWWKDSWGKDAPAPAPRERLTGDWWLESGEGQRFDCRIPIIDFKHCTINLEVARSR